MARRDGAGGRMRAAGGRGDRLLLLGASVRALAESAAGSRLAARRFPGGLLALDYFGDDDLLRLGAGRPVRVLSLARDFRRRRSTAALARAALACDWQAVIYTGGLENHPALLRRLAARGRVLGNGAGAVARVRDPMALFRFLARAGLPHPRTTFPALAPRGGPAGLFKPRRSGGGGRVRPARPGERRPRGFYLQERLAGPIGSAAFVADGRRAAVLGVALQIAGWRALGGSGFRYGGSVVGPAGRLLPPAALAVAGAAASALAARFRLRGLNGFDFVLRRGRPHILEVNPRYTASMELLEELSGVNLVDLHLRALAGGPLPARPLPLRPRCLAKGILYAGSDVTAPDPERLERLGCRDRPARGERIAAGHPICTLIAHGPSPAVCRRRLEAAASRVRALLRPAQTRSGRALMAAAGTW